MRDDVPEQRDYSALDKAVLRTPPGAEASIAALAKWLQRPDQADTARAIYTWIAHNISYDTQAYFGHSEIKGGDAPRSGDARSTLARRKAVCQGFAELYQGLAEACGLECAIVSGHAKGYGFKAGDGGLESNHAWNTVKIDGRWRLLDSTWGAGAIGRDRRFEPRFTDFYFFTPPHYFIFNHYPDDPTWQLLPKPVSMATYAAIPEVRAGFFEYGIRLASHPRAEIECSGEILLRFDSKLPFEPDADIEPRPSGPERSYCIVQRASEGWELRCRLPGPGRYGLTVYGRDPGSEGNYRAIFAYSLRALRAYPGEATFPQAFGHFNACGARLTEPLEGRLKRGERSFDIVIPGAEDVAVVCADAWSHLEAGAGDRFAGKAFLKQGEATLCARFPGQKQHAGLLRYRVI
jgi:hypothetical protein